jgi:hypothetical protein
LRFVRLAGHYRSLLPNLDSTMNKRAEHKDIFEDKNIAGDKEIFADMDS